ncbi:MAG: dienelactone hydrolase family protein [Deltaproteobacteria bacterium]|nr:dienelactone hydrolase family protein [Deltaproteobacteria bacterium]
MKRAALRYALGILVAIGALLAVASARTPRLEYVERVTAGADPSTRLPMIVAIHGLGDRPDQFAKLFDGYQRPARIILPRAPLPWQGGFAWFPFRVRDQDESQLAAGIEDAADRVSALIEALVRERPTLGRPVITGFSQGGMTTFRVAAERPELIRAALPIGGLLPPALFPTASRATKPRIRGFHGEVDPAVPLAGARQAIQAFQAAGYSAVLLEYPNTGHFIPPAMRADLMNALAAATATVAE